VGLDRTAGRGGPQVRSEHDAAAFFGLFGFIFLITQHFQFALGFGPLEAGVRTLPFAAATATASLLAPVLVGRIGTKLVVAAGLTSMAVGFVWTAGLALETSYLSIVGRMLLLGGGLGLTSAPATESVMGAVPEDQFGIGSAVNDTTREVGGTSVSPWWARSSRASTRAPSPPSPPTRPSGRCRARLAMRSPTPELLTCGDHLRSTSDPSGTADSPL
jgi:hypothetical protein